jgi:hypothetical protein
MKNENKKMGKSDYSHLLTDNTPCFDIDSTSSNYHALGYLARLDGHASLTSCLNDMNTWSMTVAQVAEILITNGVEA